MPSTRMASFSQNEGLVSSHVIECRGKWQNGKGCVTWIPIWLAKKPKGFMNRPFLCGFCAASEGSELREKQSQDPEQSPITGEFSILFNGDCNEQYGRRDNVRNFGVKKKPTRTSTKTLLMLLRKWDTNFQNRTSAIVTGT